jgi:hypothetical protein
MTHAARTSWTHVHGLTGRAALCALLLASSLICLPAHADDEGKTTNVKAAFLFNFARFITWPKASFKEKDDPIIVLIIDDEKLARSLRTAVKDRSIRGRRLTVRTAKHVDADAEKDEREAYVKAVRAAHIVHLPSSASKRVEDVIETIGDRDIVAVGEGDAFTDAGGMIAFVIIDRKMAFNVNIDAVKRTRLKFSSQLLKLARITHDKD